MKWECQQMQSLIEEGRPLSDLEEERAAQHFETCQSCRIADQKAKSFREKMISGAPFEVPISETESRAVFQSVFSRVQTRPNWNWSSPSRIAVVGGFAFAVAAATILMIAFRPASTKTTPAQPGVNLARTENKPIVPLQLAFKPRPKLPQIALKRTEAFESLVPVHRTKSRLARHSRSHKSIRRWAKLEALRPPRQEVSKVSAPQKSSELAEAFYLSRVAEKSENHLEVSVERGIVAEEKTVLNQPRCVVQVTFAPDDPDPVTYSKTVRLQYFGGGNTLFAKTETTSHANYIYKRESSQLSRNGRVTNSLQLATTFPVSTTKEKTE